MCTTTSQIHKFEAAGLGKAPFQFVGIETAADRQSENTHRAAHGLVYTTNNATCCDYCGQGIMNAYRVRSADGRTFKVGCDCIRKTGDAGLIRHVTEEESQKRRTKTRERNQAKWQRQAALVEAFRAGKFDEALRSLPHPKGREGATAWDYVAWCLDNHCAGQAVYSLLAGCE